MSNIKKISATKLVENLTNKQTKATITFIKKDQSTRIMDCIPQTVDYLGYMNVKELPTGEDRKVDTRTIISATIGNTEYMVGK